ncbi:hypothetical protein ACSBR2_013413 [Camellia fascicularis]
MAASLPIFLLFSFTFLLTFSLAQKPSSQNIGIVLPVIKDVSTLQYVTHMHYGSNPMVPIKLVVDLGGPFLWLDCASGRMLSSHRPVNGGSLQCSRANIANGCDCSVDTVNTITHGATRGELVEDIVAVDCIDRSGLVTSITTVDHFLFSCVPPWLLNGLASGVKGMLGLGRARISLPSQLATTFGFQRKFAICLSSSNGVVLLGNEPYVSIFEPDLPNSLMYTPLISNQDGALEDYYINVKSIKINGKRLSLNTSTLSVGGTKLCTILPYTTMESTIYDTFKRAYIDIATSMNMTRVASVAHFDVCFSSNGFEKTWVGSTVPIIDLVLQSEMVKWRIHRRNSMVEVSDGVLCLGFLDGGVSPKASIVIGGHQLEDILLEFNLGTSMLGFSSSLLMRDTSCSNFKLYSMPSESL